MHCNIVYQKTLQYFLQMNERNYKLKNKVINVNTLEGYYGTSVLLNAAREKHTRSQAFGT